MFFREFQGLKLHKHLTVKKTCVAYAYDFFKWKKPKQSTAMCEHHMGSFFQEKKTLGVFGRSWITFKLYICTHNDQLYIYHDFNDSNQNIKCSEGAKYTCLTTCRSKEGPYRDWRQGLNSPKDDSATSNLLSKDLTEGADLRGWSPFIVVIVVVVTIIFLLLNGVDSRLSKTMSVW